MQSKILDWSFLD